MANYSTLKSAIQAVIKQNDNNEITGNLLQQSLLSMINSIGANYQYAGVALPSTNPGTPDQNVWYIAAGAGIYSNFNNLEVKPGEVAIFKYNGTWSKDVTNAISFESFESITDLTLSSGKYSLGTVLPSEKIEDATYRSVLFMTEPGTKVTISGAAGSTYRLWAIYDSSKQRTRIAEANANVISNPVTLTLTGDEKYVVVNLLTQYIDSSYVRIANFNDVYVQLEKTIAAIIPYIENEITSPIDGTDGIVWTNKRFINASGSVVVTTAANKVGVVEIPADCDAMQFNYSILNGGSYNKLGWFVTDYNGRILAKSQEYSASQLVPDTSVDMFIPKNAAFLYLSWNTNLTTSPVVNFEHVLQKQYEKIASLIASSGGTTLLNIEDVMLQAYMAYRYNNADYSYTKMPYPTDGSLKNHIVFSYPKSIVLETPVDAAALSRTLQYADNCIFSNPETIALDLTSETYEITNLQGNTLYYWRVYKDSSVSQLLAFGTFRTDGKVRNLLVPANSNFELPYIDNVRDIGGYLTDDGRRLRNGVLIRGNELNYNNNGTIVSYISQAGINALQAVGVDAELDFRGGIFVSSALGPDVAYANIPIDLIFFRLNIYVPVTTNLQNIALAIRQFLNWARAGKCVYAHCQGGCDRTGAFCAFIEGICGVSENDINHDYEISGRDRSREYYTADPLKRVGDRALYDGDFKYAMEYIKGLKKYNDAIYTKCRSFKNSYIVINGASYQRDEPLLVSGVAYYKWTNGSTSYYTREDYPTTNSIVYNSSYVNSGLSITETHFVFYFNTRTVVQNYMPVPITDTSIIAALDAMEKPALKQQFRLLLEIGGLTKDEMDELEMILCS